MKKLFYIFAILFTVFNTTAWGNDNTRNITVKWELETNPSGYIIDNYTVTDANGKCTSELDYNNKTYVHISSEAEKKFTCPKDINTLQLKFHFRNLGAGLSDFSETINLTDKKTYKIEKTLTYHKNQFSRNRAATPTTSKTITISGTVNDDMGPVIGVNVYAIDSNGKIMQATNGSIGAATDINGQFEIKNFPSDARLKISYVGFETQIFTVDQWNKKNNKTTLKDNIGLNEVTVNSCKAEDREKLNASGHQLHHESNTCIPLICKTGFTLVTADNKPYTMSPECQDNVNSDECAFGDFGIKCLKTTGNCATDKHADTSKYELKEGTYVCEIKTCKSGYKPNDDGSACIKMAEKCNDIDRKKLEDAGASPTGLRAGTEICIALDCKCGYTLNGEKCDPWEKDQNGKYTKPCEESDLEKLNAKSGILACNDRGKAFCEITECISSDYTHNTEKNTCDSKNKTPCDPMPENATDAEYRMVDGKLVCIINKCADGYERNADKTKCNPTPKLSQEDSKKKIAELQENADAMRDKEQSTANKLLGGATMAATGIGGMQAMSAMAEQSADADAEEAMRAYLATFHCNYGGGMNIPGGEKDVQLPGGNELVGLYSEYVNLANDLKVRKNALGMKPGIESESILDAATSGLYDDVAIGKTTGAFTSLARALQNPDGPDAAAWAAQKSDTANKLKTGATIAGIGAVGGAVGNLLINKNAPKENSKEINKKYEKLKKVVQDAQPQIDAIPKKKCSEFTGTNDTGEAPNCTCTDSKARFFVDQDGCVKCENDMEYNEQNQCVKIGCALKGMFDTEKCTCVTNATETKGQCECNKDYTETNGQCTKTEQSVDSQDKQNDLVVLDIKTDTAFTSGSAEITDTARRIFKESLIDGLTKQSALENVTDYCVHITGHTDRTQFKKTSSMNNQKLSAQRANAIKQIFIDAGVPDANILAQGKAETECTKEKHPQNNDAACRHVKVTITTGTCDGQTGTPTATGELTNLLNNLTSAN